MYGRDVIIRIMEQGLENTDVFSREFLEAFMPTIESVAATFNVGVATVDAWIKMDCLKGFEYDGQVYIFPNSFNEFAVEMACREVENAK